MNFRNLNTSASPGGNPVRSEVHLPASKRTSLTLLLLAGILLLGAVTGLAKDKTPQSKTVSGVVTDETDNFIQGATIELKDLQSGKVLDIYSQEGGQYQFTDLRFDHDYTVQATYKDESSEVRQISSIDLRARLVVNLALLKPNK